VGDRQHFGKLRLEQIDRRGFFCKPPWIHNGVIMFLLRLVIGRSLVAVGLALTLAAFWLIVSTAGGSAYMYVVWGLGLLAMSLGFNSLPKKKKRRASPFAGPPPGRSDDNSRDVPAIQKTEKSSP
jgi:hypothetical protein